MKGDSNGVLKKEIAVTVGNKHRRTFERTADRSEKVNLTSDVMRDKSRMVMTVLHRSSIP